LKKHKPLSTNQLMERGAEASAQKRDRSKRARNVSKRIVGLQAIGENLKIMDARNRAVEQAEYEAAPANTLIKAGTIEHDNLMAWKGKETS
jgi:hypothetical protein